MLRTSDTVPKDKIVEGCKTVLPLLGVDFTFKPRKFIFKCVAYPDARMTFFNLRITNVEKNHEIHIEKQHDIDIVWWRQFRVKFAKQLSLHVRIQYSLPSLKVLPTSVFSFDAGNLEVYKLLASSDYVDVSLLGASGLYKYVKGTDLDVPVEIENVVGIFAKNLLKDYPPLQCLSIHALCKMVEDGAFLDVSRQVVQKTIVSVTNLLSKPTTLQYLETHRQCVLFLQKTIQPYDRQKQNAKNILGRKILYDDTRLNTIVTRLLIKI